MSRFQPEGRAILYAQGAFTTTYGKTAHGLVRRSHRYEVLSVVDAVCAGQDAGTVLDGKPCGIPIVATVDEAVAAARAAGASATHLVFGVAPDGGRLTADQRGDLITAMGHGLNIVAGLHDFLSEDAEFTVLANRHGVSLIDARKPPPRSELHAFTGKIEDVDCLKVAVLGTDSALGKRTTAWLLVDALAAAGHRAEMIGTGQTAWLQGARYSTLIDAMVNDFVSGEIEHTVWRAWHEQRPDVVVIEGQGSLMNPAYPGGFEILAAGRPDVVVLQHAPARREYDGFPGYPLHPIQRQIEAIALLSDRPVVAIALNHEGLTGDQVSAAADALRAETGLPVCDPLRDGAAPLVAALKPWLSPSPKAQHG